MTARQKAADFLKICHQFQLGFLPTEQPHPKTKQLSEWAQTDLKKALSVLREIDEHALTRLLQAKDEIISLAKDVKNCLDQGGRIFMAGCGATGRLALSLEQIWKEIHGAHDDRVRSFMAGGDVALVRAVEGFEDHPEFGAQQLIESGFSNNDLLIACTEGGETPFVIGVVEKASQQSKYPPYFLFCNPTEVLVQNVERSRRVIENKSIQKIELATGPMALAGSTRLQATTVLQLAVGLALFFKPEQISDEISQFIAYVRSQSPDFLEPMIKKESEIYSADDRVIYRPFHYAITVFTDTTERAPTFSLPAFDNIYDSRDQHSLAYVSMPECLNPLEGWRKLLGRPPRPLNWPQYSVTSEKYLLGFDFSRSAVEFRRQLLPRCEHHFFDIKKDRQQMTWSLSEVKGEFDLPHQHLLFEHLAIKLLLNMHSTLVMGRIGRYQNNLMTWVVPSNGKLVDRATRYIQHLLENRGLKVTYEDIVHALFAQMETWNGNESIVLKTLNHLAISTA